MGGLDSSLARATPTRGSAGVGSPPMCVWPCVQEMGPLGARISFNDRRKLDDAARRSAVLLHHHAQETLCGHGPVPAVFFEELWKDEPHPASFPIHLDATSGKDAHLCLHHGSPSRGVHIAFHKFLSFDRVQQVHEGVHLPWFGVVLLADLPGGTALEGDREVPRGGDPRGHHALACALALVVCCPRLVRDNALEALCTLG